MSYTSPVRSAALSRLRSDIAISSHARGRLFRSRRARTVLVRCLGLSDKWVLSSLFTRGLQERRVRSLERWHTIPQVHGACQNPRECQKARICWVGLVADETKRFGRRLPIGQK